MKIATWNVERLRHKDKLSDMTEICVDVSADIFVLTETDTRLDLGYKTRVQTLPLADTAFYQSTERRVEICSNYELIGRRETFDEYTAVCAELMTERGALLVYGVIIGIFGNRHENFKADLPRIIADIDRLTAEGKPLCVCGDFNISFSDNYYYTKDGRTALEDMFTRNDIELLTRSQPECIDHIAVSRGFIDGLSLDVREWNHDKKLSDHKGVMVELK
jgi:endonuclease/exonuclease/phosphatase family metal-dependent hydrolase